MNDTRGHGRMFTSAKGKQEKSGSTATASGTVY